MIHQAYWDRYDIMVFGVKELKIKVRKEGQNRKKLEQNIVRMEQWTAELRLVMEKL